ncbi:MAG: sulfotransferase [Actinobacteria bacterium]|nr:sulfotransferase [Actinomycetota bacterium]
MQLRTMKLYAATTRRVLPRASRLGREERLVFVVGSPRSGTTFLAGAIGGLAGFVDLGEVAPLKGAVPALYGNSEAAARIRTILNRVRRLGFVTGLRAVEQTPEVAFVLKDALRAFPEAKALHIVRDGRDAVCSLLERGWLAADRSGADDARLPYGARARFWVEPERMEEFEHASEATRAAWAWRRYVSSARSVDERVLEIRYEALAGSHDAVAAHLGVPDGQVRDVLAAAHTESIARFREDLTAEQLADVEREAGPLLRELGYE